MTCPELSSDDQCVSRWVPQCLCLKYASTEKHTRNTCFHTHMYTYEMSVHVVMMRCCVTGVLLRTHGSADDIIEMSHPILLLQISFTGEEKAALGGLDGDGVLPAAVIMSSCRQSDVNAVAVIPVSQKHLAFSKRVLTNTHTALNKLQEHQTHPT